MNTTKPPTSEASRMRDAYLDFADNIEPPPSSKYARALGAMSADYEGCLADLRLALGYLQSSAWRDTEQIKLCEMFLLRAVNSHNPTAIKLPLGRKTAA